MDRFLKNRGYSVTKVGETIRFSKGNIRGVYSPNQLLIQTPNVFYNKVGNKVYFEFKGKQIVMKVSYIDESAIDFQEIIEEIEKENDLTFQFPLWDSTMSQIIFLGKRTTFNSLYGIPLDVH